MTEYRHHCRLMGCAFELIVADENGEQAQLWLQQGVEEIKRIEQLLTEYDEGSETSLLNRNAGKEPVKVSHEVYDLLVRCSSIATLTQGAFDISIGPLKKLYHFKKGDYNLPSRSLLQATLCHVGHEHILLLPDCKVLLRKKGMRISFAAIGKGYAADKVKQLWVANGVKAGVVNASGDLTVIGTKADSSSWQAGIANPDEPNSVLLYVPLHDCSIATSGDYEQYFIKDGVRYSHTLNPKTGYPLTGVKSVSIISHSAELCDALATAVYVMGVEVGLHFVAQLPDVKCIMVDNDNRLVLSKNIAMQKFTEKA